MQLALSSLFLSGGLNDHNMLLVRLVRDAAPRGSSVAVSHAVRSMWRQLSKPAASSGDPHTFWNPPIVQPTEKADVMRVCMQADPTAGFVGVCVQVRGRIGVHSLSQVLSTVLVCVFFC